MLSLRCLTVWRRNQLVWRKLLFSSLVSNLIDPLIYLLALGFGIGHFVNHMEGISYLAFLASGIVCSSAMHSATFEGLYSAYARMMMQKTWEGMLTAPLSVSDILLGEALWAATKAVISASAIFLVSALLGLVHTFYAVFIIPVAFLLGFCFANMALVVTAIAKGFDFFNYYFTLFISPMMFLSGVFFPLNSMPKAIQCVAMTLPLYHAVALVRPLMTGGQVQLVALHLTVLLLYALLAYRLALFLLQKRMVN
jgi:lipooligosaccharide transport system permease protein